MLCPLGGPALGEKISETPKKAARSAKKQRGLHYSKESLSAYFQQTVELAKQATSAQMQAWEKLYAEEERLKIAAVELEAAKKIQVIRETMEEERRKAKQLILRGFAIMQEELVEKLRVKLSQNE